MKSEDVVVGEKYTVRISGNLVPVRIDATAKLHRFSKSYNGWTGTNLKTGRPVTILTAAKLRGVWLDEEEQRAELIELRTIRDTPGVWSQKDLARFVFLCNRHKMPRLRIQAFDAAREEIDPSDPSEEEKEAAGIEDDELGEDTLAKKLRALREALLELAPSCAEDATKDVHDLQHVVASSIGLRTLLADATYLRARFLKFAEYLEEVI